VFDNHSFLWIAPVVAFWNQIKSLLLQFSTLFWTQSELRYDSNTAPVINYLMKNSKESGTGISIFGAQYLYRKSLKRMSKVGWEFPGKSKWILYKNRPISISYENTKNGPNLIKLGYIRGTLDIRKVIHESIEEAEKGLNLDRFYIRTFIGAGVVYKTNDQNPPTGEGEKASESSSDGGKPLGILESDLGYPRTKAPFQHLFYSKEIDDLVETIKMWCKSQDWFLEKGIPWQMGVNLSGKPGTGKTCLVRALGQEFDLPIHVYDLSTMNNHELVRFWKQTCSATPCIALFEDIDRLFNEKQEFQSENGLTLDRLLNCISGVETANGVLTILTANYPERLDPALGVMDSTGRSTRPGRVDRCIKLGDMEGPQRRKLAQLIMVDHPEEIDQMVVAGEGETPAQFQRRCADRAQKLFWEAK